MAVCPTCGTENVQGKKFCRKCGLALALACPSCGALVQADDSLVDSRERYPYRFTGRDVQTERAALPAGDYAVRGEDGVILAAVERKSLENLATTLSDGTLAFQVQRLAELPLAAVVVVEGRYPALFGSEHVPGDWLEPIGHVPPAEFEAAHYRKEDPNYTAGLKEPSLR